MCSSPGPQLPRRSQHEEARTRRTRALGLTLGGKNINPSLPPIFGAYPNEGDFSGSTPRPRAPGRQSPSGPSPRRGRETPRREVPRGALRKIPPIVARSAPHPRKVISPKKSQGLCPPNEDQNSARRIGPAASPPRARIKRTPTPRSASPRARSTAQNPTLVLIRGT